MTDGTKKCPYCGEEVLTVAIKCKHCGSDLKKEPGASNDNIGYLMLLIPLISIFLLWFWVGNMSLIQGPQSKVMLIGIFTVLATSILAFYEASQLGFGKNPKETKPIVYFIGMVLLWVIVYPIYLYQRSKKGRKSLVVGGVVVAIAFACSLYLLQSSIESGLAEIRRILN